MRIAIEKLASENARIAVVTDDAKNVHVFSLQEIASCIDEHEGQVNNDDREGLMLMSASMILRMLNTHSIADNWIVAHSEEDSEVLVVTNLDRKADPPDSESIDDRWDADEELRNHPLIAHNPDPDIPF